MPHVFKLDTLAFGDRRKHEPQLIKLRARMSQPKRVFCDSACGFPGLRSLSVHDQRNATNVTKTFPLIPDSLPTIHKFKPTCSKFSRVAAPQKTFLPHTSALPVGSTFVQRRRWRVESLNAPHSAVAQPDYRLNHFKNRILAPERWQRGSRAWAKPRSPLSTQSVCPPVSDDPKLTEAVQ